MSKILALIAAAILLPAVVEAQEGPVTLYKVTQALGDSPRSIRYSGNGITGSAGGTSWPRTPVGANAIPAVSSHASQPVLVPISPISSMTKALRPPARTPVPPRCGLFRREGAQ